MNVFQKSANWIAQSYWLIAISILKDVIEVAYKGYQFGFETSLNSVDWIDVITKAILAFAVVHIFRNFNENKKEVEEIKQGYLEQQLRFTNQNYVSSLVNLTRLDTIISQKWTFVNDEIKYQELQKRLDNEKIWVKNNLINLQKQLTVEQIESMVEDYYQINFLTPSENQSKPEKE